MILRPKMNWFRMLFVWHGSVLPSILAQLLLVWAISSLVAWSHGRLFGYTIPLNVAPFTLIGVALALFLGFRNSASYDRYWEGRKLWGSLLIVTRSLSRQALSIGGMQTTDPEMETWTSLLIAFAHALRHQLRGSNPDEDLHRLLSPERSREILAARYRPAIVLVMLGKWVVERKREGVYGEITATALDHNLNHMSEVLGGCERLANTPLPYAYSVMIHRTVYVYCFLLPFGLVSSIGAMTPVVSVFVAYTFMVLEALAAELDQPFGTLPNSLPLASLCETIEDSLREMSGNDLGEIATASRKFIVL
jgi:putative membrane protein